MLELKDTGTASGVEYQTKIEQVVKVKTEKERKYKRIQK